MKLLFGTSPTPLEILESGLVIICLIIAFTRPSLGKSFFVGVESALRWLAGRPRIAAAVLFALPLALRALLLPAYGTPSPIYLDEHSYLLLGDTFAHGRLANPTHPLWPHFETIYVLSQPTYASQYQVVQGLVLAAGEVLAGNPWAGVFVSVGILCVVLYWALRGWLPPVWALFGGLVAVFQIGVLSYWMNSYFGGCVAATGGALTLGALPRLRERRSARYAAIAALGIATVMNSRPLEAALLFVVTSGAALFWLLVTNEFAPALFARNIVLPTALVLFPTLAAMGYYNYRVTGHVTEFPYTLNRKLYGTPQGFFWQKPIIIDHFRFRDIQDIYENQLALHERRHSIKELANATVGKTRTYWTFYIGPALTTAFVFLPFIWRGRNMGFALAASVVFGLNAITFFAFFPHYAAPVTALFFIVLLECWRRMRGSGAAGLFLSRALPVICVLGVAIPMCGRYVQSLAPSPKLAKFLEWEFGAVMAREVYLKQLEAQDGNQLVLVRYKHPGHVVDNEWVYNEADIDHAKVVWARAIDPESDRRLIQYFAGRKVWLGEPDEFPPRLTPYPSLGVALR